MQYPKAGILKKKAIIDNYLIFTALKAAEKQA